MGATARAVVLAIMMALPAGMAGALSLEEAARPAERPPEAYEGEVYVDSRGCLYVRADIGLKRNWVPRLTRDRLSVVCGLSAEAARVALMRPQEGAPHAERSMLQGQEPRQIDVSCPPSGATARVRVGAATVTVHCPLSMTRPSSALVTHLDGSQTRLVTHPRPGQDASTPGTGFAQVSAEQPDAETAAWLANWLTPDNRLRTPLGDIELTPVINEAPQGASPVSNPWGGGQ